MSVNNGYITAPVTMRDIARAIGVPKKGKSYYLTNLGIHPNVSRWSSRKPIDRDTYKPLTDHEAKQDKNFNPYGLVLPFIGNNVDADGNPIYHPDNMQSEDGTFAEWIYNKPGLIRQSDFEGYEHYIDELFEVTRITFDKATKELIVDFAINQVSCQNDESLNLAGGNAGNGVSWGHLTPRNFYLPGSNTETLAQRYIGVALWNFAYERWIYIKTDVQPIGAQKNITVRIPTFLFDDVYVITPCISLSKYADGEYDEELPLYNCIAIEMAETVAPYITNDAIGTLLLTADQTGGTGLGYVFDERSTATGAMIYKPKTDAGVKYFDEMPLRTLIISGDLVDYMPPNYERGVEYRIPITTLNVSTVAGDMHIYLTIKYSAGWSFGLYIYEESTEAEYGESYDGMRYQLISRVVISNNISGYVPQSCEVTVYYADDNGEEQSFTFPRISAYISYEKEGSANRIYIGANTTAVTTNLDDSFNPDFNAKLIASLSDIY